eukprot:Stramenopile-MAST_4_protein_4809
MSSAGVLLAELATATGIELEATGVAPKTDKWTIFQKAFGYPPPSGIHRVRLCPILQTFSGQVQDVDDEQSEGDDPDVDHKNGPFNVVDQFDLQITPSQFRRLCGLAAMATYQAEWGGQRGHIVHSLSTGELEASEVSQSFQTRTRQHSLSNARK